MKTTTITLFGHEYKLAINFSTHIYFEELSKDDNGVGTNIFDYKFFHENTMKALLILFYAMLKGNNADSDVPELDEILAIEDNKKVAEITSVTSQLWKTLINEDMNKGKKKGSKKDGKKDSEKEEGDPKNA